MRPKVSLRRGVCHPLAVGGAGKSGSQPPPENQAAPQQASQLTDLQNKNAQNGNPGQGPSGGSGAPSRDNSKPSHPPLAAAKIPFPGSIPDVARLTMESPRETDISAIAEATQLRARAATPAESFPVPPFQTPALPASAVPANPEAVSVEAERRLASLLGNTTPGSPALKREAESAENPPSFPNMGNAPTTKSAAASARGEAGVFNVDPRYPTSDGRMPKRINVGFSSANEEADEPGLPRSVSPLVYNANPGLPLLGKMMPTEHRGILSHVGDWCRTIGPVAACSK